MGRYKQLLREINGFGSDYPSNIDRTSKPGKTARASTLVDLDRMMAKAQAAVGKVLVKGKTAMTDKPVAAAPKEHVALRHEALKHAIVQHAVANENPNSPISEAMLNRVLKMAKAGHLSDDQARRTVACHSKGLSLPTDVMHAIGGN